MSHTTTRGRHSAPTTRWGRFRARRVLGVPAPIVAAVLAVALTGGVALAAILLSAKATVQGNVKALPVLLWQDQSDYDPFTVQCDGVSANVTLSADLTTLQVNIADAYPGSSFDTLAWLLVPNGSSTLKITGFSLGNADKMTATLVSTLPVYGGNAANLPPKCDGSAWTTNERKFTFDAGSSPAAVVVGSTLTGGPPALNGTAATQYAVRIHVSVLATATAGAFSETVVPGLTIQIV